VGRRDAHFIEPMWAKRNLVSCTFSERLSDDLLLGKNLQSEKASAFTAGHEFNAWVFL